MSDGYTTVRVDREGAVDWLTLNRPERLNTLNGAMVRELWTYFSRLEANFSRRIVVLRGAGAHFCAGMDLKAQSDPGERLPSGQATAGPEASLSGVVRLMRRCPQPIISLVHGSACGGGFALALASDIRIAGETARMNDAFVKLGLSGCELGLSFFLPRIVGLSIAAELMMTGAFIDAERAKAVGLVSSVTTDAGMADAARGLVAQMLRTSPLGLRQTKATLNQALRLSDLDAVINLEEHAQITCMQSGDFHEATRAFLEKREPRYAT
ncbi:MAG: enoyl-CoA hydratase/isomerase family protein [Caulobacterales bacterium]|nr:enoyl-CoA hydratase/isomerase family protein [Caulobacterales bacterium]